MINNHHSSNPIISHGRRRPGSESDVLDVKASEVSIHHQVIKYVLILSVILKVYIVEVINTTHTTTDGISILLLCF